MASGPSALRASVVPARCAGITRAERRVLMWGFAAGLVIRIAMLASPGVFDLDIYETWARVGLEQGLVQAYRLPLTNVGSYYPTEMLLLMLCRALADGPGLGFHIALKLLNGIFDAGTFALLVHLLHRIGAPPAYALIQWLHPWFLVIFSLGYVDFHFVFFMLATAVLLERGSGWRDALLAGLPLAVAFTMKPQAQVPLLAIAAFAGFEARRTGRLGPLAVLALPAIAFVGWSGWFAASIMERTGVLDPFFLAERYLRASEILPCLNGTKLNAWYPIALWLAPPGAPVWAVSDQIRVWGPLQVKHVAALAVLTLVFAFAWAASRGRRHGGSGDLRGLCTVAFAAFAVPFVMTQAHENHTFLASVLLVPLLATSRSLPFHVAVHAILLLDAVNALALYERGEWAHALREVYTPGIRVALSLLESVAFAVAAASLTRRVGVSEPR